MRKHHDRRTARQPFNIILQPCQLILAQLPKPVAAQSGSTSLFQIQNINKPDEMYALIVEALPALALSSARESLTIELSLVIKHIVLAWYIKHLACLESLEDLRRRIELLSAGKMRDVARVNHKRRLVIERIDLIDCFLKRLRHIVIWILIEPDMAIADLDETEPRLSFRAQNQFTRAEHASVHGPNNSGSC